MGTRGAKLTQEAESTAERLVDAFGDLGEVSRRKMFGGVGIFEDGTMFGIVDSAGGAFLRADDRSVSMFTSAGSERHGRMPYYSIPEAVLGDRDTLLEWAREAIAASRRSKKK